MKTNSEPEDPLAAIVQIAQSLLSQPAVRRAVQRLPEWRDMVVRASTFVLEELDLPSADQVERVADHLKSVSRRIERLEDAVARMDDAVDSTSGGC